MAVRVVSPQPRDRCNACALRFHDDDLQGPVVDFGDFWEGEGPVELVNGGRFHAHHRVLVCGGCLRKALRHVPEFGEQEQRHRQAVEVLETRARAAEALAHQFAVDVAGQLDVARQAGLFTAGSTDERDAVPPSEPAGVTAAGAIELLQEADETVGGLADEPPGGSGDGAEPKPTREFFEGLTVREIRKFFKDRDEPIPADVTAKSDLVDLAVERFSGGDAS